MHPLYQERDTKVAVLGLGTATTTLRCLTEAGIDADGYDGARRVGGHIHSVRLKVRLESGKVKHFILEGGAEFIGNNKHYPHVHRMFKCFHLKLKEFMLTHTLTNTNTDEEFISPPPEGFKRRLLGFFRLPKSRRHQLLKDLTSKLSMLKVTVLASQEGSDIDNNPERFRTIEEFMNEYEWAGDDKAFLETYFYFVIAAAWGVSDIEKIKKFGAHYALHYLALGTKWYDAPDGLSSYMHRLKQGIPEENIHLKTKITKLEAHKEGERFVYKLKKADGTYVVNEAGEPVIYTDVMLSMNAEIMKDILPEGIDDSIDELKRLLADVEYYDTHIIFHTDDSYRSRTGTVVHTIVDEHGIAANTACKEWKYKNDDVRVYKTWWHEGQPKPLNILRELKYRHPIMDKRYFMAQEKLRSMQGKFGLHFGGILAGERDSHEEGMKAAGYVSAHILSREGKLGQSPLLSNVFPEMIEKFQCNPETSQDDLRHAGYGF